MTTIIQDGHRRCDARCYNAKGPKCRCICDGKNHGKGKDKAVENNQVILTEILDPLFAVRFSFEADATDKLGESKDA